MNPYWINPTPDSDEWLLSQRAQSQFWLFVAGHIVLWVIAAVGMVVLYVNAQKTAPIQAFTAYGEPAWGVPMALGEADTLKKQSDFLDKHLRNLFTHLLMRTEKGSLPILNNYTTDGLMKIIDRDFDFAKNKKGGYSQAFYVEDMQQLIDRGVRRVYRIKGLLSAHSLDGSSNTPVYLVAAVDRKDSTTENPLGWVVSAIISVSPEEYYSNERQALIEQVTSPRLNKPTKNP